MKNSTTILSLIYIIIVVFNLNAALDSNLNYEFISKFFLSITLLLIYVFAVKKEHFKKLYLVMLLFIGVGEVFYVFIDTHFYISIYSYMIAHLIFIYLISKHYLKKQSLFDIFTFSLPFLFIFSVAYVLFNIQFLEGIKIIITGIVACLNATLVLLNYANSRTVQNYLFFIGIIIWLMVDALSGVYMFNFKDEVYYLLTILLDAIAQYMICRAFILDGIDEEDLLRG